MIFDSIYRVKDTYSIRELQRDTAGAVREAEAGVLVTVTRNDHPVAHVISADRLGSLLETMELVADPAFARELRKLLSNKQKFHPVSALAD
jgi:prevent-host-death family protein